LTAGERWALAALGFLVAVTGAWWALALWPLPAESPAWLERTRAVCFNTGPTGLPDASGWILLVGQPLGMIGILLAGWRSEVASALRAVARTPGGRLATTAGAVAVVVGSGAAAVRIGNARPTTPGLPDLVDVPLTYPRLDRPVPDMTALVDQEGRAFDPAVLRERPTLVTFGFGHCETICPVVVRSALEVRDALAGERDLRVVALTLDPWRDTPSRLGVIAEDWGLGPGDLMLGGSVVAVESALDAWDVARSRDERTGDVIHPALVYLVEPDGTVAYASNGAPGQLRALALRLK
jgi:protein SCO1/2